MNARIGQAVNVYAAIEHLKLRQERMKRELQTYVNVLTEQEMAEYIEACEKIDHRVEAKR